MPSAEAISNKIEEIIELKSAIEILLNQKNL